MSSEIRFGVELEFYARPRTVRMTIAPEWAEGMAENHLYQRCLERDSCYHNLARALVAIGLPAAYKREIPMQSVFVGKSVTFIDPETQASRTTDTPSSQDLFSHWLFKLEYDIDGAQFRKYIDIGWIPAELNTPILSELEVQDGCPQLTNAVSAILEEKIDGIHINTYCGLHVHVSIPGEMTLRRMKRAVTLAWLLEDQLLFPICANHRRGMVKSLTNCIYFYHMRTNFAAMRPRRWTDLADSAEDDVPLDILTQEPDLAAIWGCKSLDELGLLVSGSSQAYTPTGGLCLGLQRSPMKDTLEFRYAQSTFSQAFLKNWVGLVATIFKLTDLPETRFRVLLRSLRGAASREEGPLSLLSILGHRRVEDWHYRIDVDYWKQRLAENEATYTVRHLDGSDAEDNDWVVYPDIRENGLTRADGQANNEGPAY